MAKPELRDHRKFLKLKRLLNAPTPHVLGYLDCLWHRGYQTGSPFIGDALDVEAAAEYPGETGTFTEAAHQSGFIDRDENGNYLIHDLFDHAPAYAKKRMRRRGTAPKSSHLDRETTEVGPNASHVVPNGTENTKNEAARDTDPRSKNLEPRTENLQNANPPDGGGKETNPKVTRAPSPMDPIFDAVAEVSGLDPNTAAQRIATAAAILYRAKPAYSPEEIHEFGRRFWELCPWAIDKNRQRPTPHEIAHHIGLLRAPPAPKQTVRAPPRTKAEQQTDYALRTFPKQVPQCPATSNPAIGN